MRPSRSILIVLIFVFILNPLNACFILVLTDGTNVIVGNHEDWFDTDTAIRILPPNEERYGSVIFTFMSEGWAQGGMNSKGLFFDGTFTPYDFLEFPDGMQEYNGYLWQKILDECRTVQQALDTAMKYKTPELEEVHIVFADASGEAAVLGTDNGHVTVSYKEGPYQLQTNFNPIHPELSDEPSCWRYELASEHLENDATATVENMLSILNQTHQDELTVYTNIYNLTTREIIVFSQRKFDQPIKINLQKAFETKEIMIPLEDLLRKPNLFDK